MRHRQFLFACIWALCQSAQAQPALAGKPESWPAPELIVNNECSNISGTYTAQPADEKVQDKTTNTSLGSLVFLYTPGRLNVPSWMRHETSEVEFHFAPADGITITAWGKNRSNTISRRVPANELECRDGVMRLKWKYEGHTEGTSHNDLSYLEMYRTQHGALIVSDNLVARATTLFFFSHTTERHDWFLYPPAKKP